MPAGAGGCALRGFGKIERTGGRVLGEFREGYGRVMGGFVKSDAFDNIHVITSLGGLGRFCGGGPSHMRVRACVCARICE